MFTSTITSVLFAVMLVPGSNGLDGVGVLEPTCLAAKHAYCCQVHTANVAGRRRRLSTLPA